MSKTVVLLIAALLLLVLHSCKYPMMKKEEPVLARVGDEYLSESDIKDLVPEGISPKDSINLVRNYVNNWVKTTLMVHQAKENLTS